MDAGLPRFLANMSEKRTDGLENVPTLKELGYNVEYSVNRGIMGSKGTPADVVAKIESKLVPRRPRSPNTPRPWCCKEPKFVYMDLKGLGRLIWTKTDGRDKKSPRTLVCLSANDAEPRWDIRPRSASGNSSSGSAVHHAFCAAGRDRNDRAAFIRASCFFSLQPY